METGWQSTVGVVAFPLLAWALSERQRRVDWRIVLVGLALQVAIGSTCLGLSPIRAAFLALNDAVRVLEEVTLAGTSFVFGFLGGAPPPFDVTHPEASFVLAFQALPLVLVISALAAVLFHWRVLGRRE